ncbi:MAG: hypothetical protein DVB31_16275, partial [Verrucomicrobia bacterium]
SPDGALVWPVPPDASGDYPVTVGVADPSGARDQMTFTLRVPPAQPDLAVVKLLVPAGVDTDAPFNVTLRESNLGRAAAKGPWSAKVWLSRDAQWDAGDTLLGTYPFAGTLLPGQFIERTLQFRAPRTVGRFHVLASTDADNTVVEVSEANNLAVAGPLDVAAAYGATVSTDFESGVSGTPVPLRGTATLRGGGPAAFALVNLHVFVRGTHRVISALADAAGHFAANFLPLPGEAGEYSVGAAHPGADTAPVQDTFRLLGLRAEPGQATVSLAALGRATQPLDLVNLSQAALTGLTLTVEGAPAGLDVAATLPPRLEGDARTGIEVSIQSTVDADWAGTVRLRIVTAEGPQVVVPLEVRVASLVARLATDPAALRVGVLRGGQALATLTLRNDGGRATGPLHVALPPVPWITVVESQPLAPLAPGESRLVTLQFRPPSDTPPGLQDGAIGIGDGHAATTVPFALGVLSESFGELRVEAVDEYTFYAEGTPRVSGARVVVHDATGETVVGEATTGPDGRAVFPRLREGWYTVDVTADDHRPARASAFVGVSEPAEVQAFLPREAVKYFFGVEEVAFEERTRVTIETVFETAVPMPVVTLEPNLIDLEAIAQDRSEFEVTVTNHGLIAAKALRLAFHNSAGWRFSTVQTDFGDLPARSSITVPVILERLAPTPVAARSAAPAAVGGGCPGFDAIYQLVCGRQTNSYLVPGGTSGGGCGAFGQIDPGGVGGEGGFIHPVGFAAGTPVPCEPCLADVAKALQACALNFIPLGPIPGAIRDVYGCVSAPSVLGCLGAVVSVAAAAGKEIPGLGTAISTLDCLLGLRAAADACAADGLGGPGGGGGGTGGGGTGGGGGTNPHAGVAARRSAAPANTITQVVPGLDGIRTQIDRLSAILGPYGFILGDPAFLARGQGAKAQAFLDAFLAAQTPESDGGLVLTQTEIATLLAGTRPDGVTDAMVLRFAARWNRTLDYAGRGIFRTTDVPPGQSTDFLALDLLLPIAKAAAEALAANEADGFLEPMDAVRAATDRLRATLASAAAGGSVCAHVRIRLDQDVVQARQGFKASLEIDNGGTAPLENLRVELVLLDASGAAATARFAVLPPELAAITAVDGTGVLPAGAIGKANWLIVPGVGAAPTPEAERYAVGGTLAYTQAGVHVTIPLAPVSIRVLPVPRLTLQYFHERDVLSDDPFTPGIEPTVPYSLAVLVNNHGAGTARSLRITSSQPQIVENEKGLLIGFQLIATEVEGANLNPGLTADFGDVGPDQTKIGRWLFTSTLQGQFIAYSATFEHLGPLSGHPEAASVQDVSIHELIHVVRAVGPDDDRRIDFLVNEVPDDDFLPDTLYRSDGKTNHVGVLRTAVPGAPPSADRRTTTLTIAPQPGWTYLRVPEPSAGTLALRRVLRPDGTEVPFGDNVWVTDRTFVAGGRRPVYEHNLHLFDFVPAGSGPIAYTLVYELPPAPDLLPPESHVAALPAASRAQFPVSWDGTDNGSGIASFDILVSTDGGPFVTWLAGTTGRSALFAGVFGRHYDFVSVATDAAGNRESTPATPDASTTVSRTNQPPAFPGPFAVSVDEGATAVVDAHATDGDVPRDRIAYRLDADAPPGARIHPSTGLVTWPTGEGTGP